MEPFELLLAACFVWTYNVHVFTQTWTRAFRVRTRVGRSVVQGVRAWRLGSSNVRDREQARERQRERERERERESASMDLYTRIRQSRLVYTEKKRKKRNREKERKGARVIRPHHPSEQLDKPSSTTGKPPSPPPPPANWWCYQRLFLRLSSLFFSSRVPFPLPFTLPPPPLAITLCSTL